MTSRAAGAGGGHLGAIVAEASAALLKPTPITEDAAGYRKLIALLGSATDTLVVCEAIAASPWSRSV